MDFQQTIDDLKGMAGRLDEIAFSLFDKIEPHNGPIRAAWVAASQAAINAEQAYKALEKA